MSLCLIAGCGPGAPELVTPEVRRAALDCEVLAGVPRLLDLFPESPARRVPYDQGLSPFLAALAPELGHQRVTVLVTGDPGIASLAGTLARKFPQHTFRRLPGLSSIQLAYAAAGLDHLDGLVIRAHGQVPDWNPMWDLHTGPFAILAGAPQAPAFVSDLALRLGRSRIWVCERLSLPGERITVVGPPTLAREGCDPLSVLIVEGVSR